MQSSLARLAAQASVVLVAACANHTRSPAPPDPPFVKLAAQHFDSLQRDTVIQRLTGAKTGLEVIGSQPIDAFWRLSDSEMVSFARLLAESLEKVDTITCGTFANSGAWAQNFTKLTFMVDSSLAMRWVLLFDQLVRTGLEDKPRGDTASSAEVSSAVSAVTKSLPPAERVQILQALTSPHGSLAARCLFAVRYFHSFGDMTPSRAGPILRSLLGTPPE